MEETFENKGVTITARILRKSDIETRRMSRSDSFSKNFGSIGTKNHGIGRIRISSQDLDNDDRKDDFTIQLSDTIDNTETESSNSCC